MKNFGAAASTSLQHATMFLIVALRKARADGLTDTDAAGKQIKRRCVWVQGCLFHLNAKRLAGLSLLADGTSWVC